MASEMYRWNDTVVRMDVMKREAELGVGFGIRCATNHYFLSCSEDKWCLCL